MKTTIKAIAALSMLAFSAPAIAGGVNVYDDGESKLKLGGKVFLDATSLTNKGDGTVANNGIKQSQTKGFNLGRAYLTAKYTFNSDWMMRVTTDVGQEAGLGKKTNVFLKYAYVQGKLIDDALVLRAGVSHNPWIDYEQGLWKHRYFTKVTSDQFKYDDSADLGLGFKGKLADGLVKYWATAVNGGGYGNLAQSNGIDYKTRIGVYPVKGLTIDVGFNTGHRGKKAWNTVTPLKQTMYQAMVSYGTHDFRIGGNYIDNKDRAKNSIKAKTYAVWGWAKVAAGFGVTGRFENEKSFAYTAGIAGTTQQVRKRIAVGLDYSPVKNVVLTAGYISDKVNTAKYTTGAQTESTQIGLWSQFKF